MFELNIMQSTTELEYENCSNWLLKSPIHVDDLEQNPYSALLDLAMHYAGLWEDEHELLVDSSTPKDVLEFWMDQHNTTQKDLQSFPYWLRNLFLNQYASYARRNEQWLE